MQALLLIHFQLCFPHIVRRAAVENLWNSDYGSSWVWNKFEQVVCYHHSSITHPDADWAIEMLVASC